MCQVNLNLLPLFRIHLDYIFGAQTAIINKLLGPIHKKSISENCYKFKEFSETVFYFRYLCIILASNIIVGLKNNISDHF